MKYLTLKYLPDDHPSRNTLLIDVRAEFKHPAWEQFRPVEPGRGLAENTFNNLEGAWKNFYEWRVPQHS